MLHKDIGKSFYKWTSKYGSFLESVPYIVLKLSKIILKTGEKVLQSMRTSYWHRLLFFGGFRIPHHVEISHFKDDCMKEDCTLLTET